MAKLVRLLTLTQAILGSSPSSPASKLTEKKKPTNLIGRLFLFEFSRFWSQSLTRSNIQQHLEIAGGAPNCVKRVFAASAWVGALQCF